MRFIKYPLFNTQFGDFEFEGGRVQVQEPGSSALPSDTAIRFFQYRRYISPFRFLQHFLHIGEGFYLRIAWRCGRREAGQPGVTQRAFQFKRGFTIIQYNGLFDDFSS